jgi:phosphate ABC transporter phosphate-binding protein
MAAALVVTAIGTQPAIAASHALIQGSGSSWSANAVNQWVADVQPNGLQVVFTASGSAQGRKDFGYKQNDFAVSDIGFQGVDPVTGDTDTSQGRSFVYLPIVAGGTSFPYQVRVAGKLVRNLRLSGQTLAKIFTNQITNWNDPAITADNNGKALPSLPIIPVVHSEGSGSSAQFTAYLDSQFPNIWRPFLGTSGLTEYFPRKGKAIAQNGSDGVINYVASSAGNGAIGYDEYSYALAQDYPVAKVLNNAGYFTLPDQYNVAVALTKAVINQDKSSPNYLLQNLQAVYTFSDERTYPLSSYSYGIIPTSATDPTMTTAKRQTLADYLYYSLCQGQREIGPLGYSPLPINLVQASFDQVAKLKAADPGVDLTKRDVSSCNNPTFIAGQPNRNYLAEIAPMPQACDKVGAGPCTDSIPNTANPGSNGKPGVSTGRNGSGSGSSSGGSRSGGSVSGGTSSASAGGATSNSSAGSGTTTRTPGATTAGTTGGTGPTAAPNVDPATGQTVDVAAGGSGGGGSAGAADPVAVTLSSSTQTASAVPAFALLTALGLVAAIVLPPVIHRRLTGRRGAP